MSSLTTLWGLVTAVCALCRVHAYQAGPGLEACDSMRPVHYGAEYKSARVSSPFTIKANQYVYADNESPYITVTISNKPTAPVLFKGFMLQARNENGTRIGTFSVNPKHKLQLLKCGDEPDVGVGHTKKISEEGMSKVEAIWIAPDDPSGNITFMATVVHHKLAVYLDLRSDPVVWRDSGAGSLSFGRLCWVLCAAAQVVMAAAFRG